MGPVRGLLGQIWIRNGDDRGGVWHRGEDAAARYMKRNGYRVVARNLRLTPGEIDLVCRSRKTGSFVLVEVKARLQEGDTNRRPEDAITSAKRRKLILLARSLMRDEEVRAAGLRIDVIAVEFSRGQRKPIAIRHYERAVSSP